MSVEVVAVLDCVAVVTNTNGRPDFGFFLGHSHDFKYSGPSVPGHLMLVRNDAGENIYNPSTQEILPASITDGSEDWSDYQRCDLWFNAARSKAHES